MNDLYPDRSQEIILICKRVVDRNLTVSSGGNISARLADGNICITPLKGNRTLADLRESDLSMVDTAGNVLRGSRPSNELPMHLAIYSVEDEAKFIIHAHPPLATAYSSEKMLPMGTMVESMRLKMAIVEADAPGSRELAEKVAMEVKRGANAVLLESHGVVILASDAGESLMILEELESACRTDLIRRILRTGCSK